VKAAVSTAANEEIKMMRHRADHAQRRFMLSWVTAAAAVIFSLCTLMTSSANMMLRPILSEVLVSV